MSKLTFSIIMILGLSALTSCTFMTLEESYESYQKRLSECPAEMAYTETTFPSNNGENKPFTIIDPLLKNGCPINKPNFDRL